MLCRYKQTLKAFFVMLYSYLKYKAFFGVLLHRYQNYKALFVVVSYTYINYARIFCRHITTKCAFVALSPYWVDVCVWRGGWHSGDMGLQVNRSSYLSWFISNSRLSPTQYSLTIQNVGLKHHSFTKLISKAEVAVSGALSMWLPFVYSNFLHMHWLYN